jgi:DNA-binding beta-propeller fold protein YncE
MLAVPSCAATATKPHSLVHQAHAQRTIPEQKRQTATPVIDATDEEMASQPGDPNALGGYNVMIADRGNNRVIVVTPDKKIIWEYDFQGLEPGTGADDSFFTPDKTRIVVNLEYQHVVQIISYPGKELVWQYGEMGKPGSSDGLLNRPDDAYVLSNGDVIVADIRNCRILEIAPDKHIVRQYGETGHCDSKAGHVAVPNGDTPMPNGHVLISAIASHSLMELDENWNEVSAIHLPLHYPSDPQRTRDGNYIIADYSYPGRVIEFDQTGKILWDYDAKGEGGLRQPSLSEELPNGNVLINDDFNHRVIVVDKASKKIVWQYGMTGRRGLGRGYLSIPDGMDIIKADTP